MVTDQPGPASPIELAAIERGAGDAVTLVHGGAFHSGPTWAKTMGPLLQAGYRVLAVDRRGYGRSGAGQALEIPMWLQAGDIIATLDAREVEASHLVGVSYGALVALEVALRYPARVASLTLIEPTLFAWLRDDPDYEAWIQRFDTLQAAARAGAPYPEWLADWLALIDPAMARALKPGAPGWTLVERALQHQWQEEGTSLYRPDPAALRALALPTLIVNGSDSEPALRAVAELLAARIGGAMHVEVANTGHQLHIDQAQVFNQLLALFLAGHAGRAQR
ncbi:MAG: hypothetical protein NVSMB32_12780 [Actinomycetota bacterium]